MTTSPICRCTTCGRQFQFIPGFTPSVTRCYLCGPEAEKPKAHCTSSGLDDDAVDLGGDAA